MTTAAFAPTGSTAPNSSSPTAAWPRSTRCSRRPPDGPSFFVVERDTPGFSVGRAGAQTRHPRIQHHQIVIEGVEVPADHLLGLEEGKGLEQANEVFGFTRLMVAAFGLGAGEEALRPGHHLRSRANPVRRAAVSQTGIHPQAHRPARGAARGGARLLRGGRRTARRRRAGTSGRRRGGQALCHRGRQRGGRRRDSGPRRVWLHPRVRGREDPP